MTLRGLPDISVVGQATSGLQTLQLVEKMRPDIVCIDINMAKLDGIDTTKQLLKLHPDLKVIGLSANIEREKFMELLNAGALGYVEKAFAGGELSIAIRSVSKNKKFIGSGLGFTQ